MWRTRCPAPAPGGRGGESLRTPGDVREAYDRYGGELFDFLFGELADRRLAEDAVQETFVRAWRTGRRFDPARGSLRAWLFAIARAGMAAGGVRPDGGQHSHGPDAFDRLLADIQIDEALRRLSPEHRQTVTEVRCHGRTCAELAASLGLPTTVIRTRLHYGVRVLRLVLEEHGWLV